MSLSGMFGARRHQDAGDERHGGYPAGRLHQRVLVLDGPPAGEPYRGGLSDHSEDLPAASQGMRRSKIVSKSLPKSWHLPRFQRFWSRFSLYHVLFMTEQQAIQQGPCFDGKPAGNWPV